MMNKLKREIAVMLLALAGAVGAQEYAADEVVVFKEPADGSALKLHIYKPEKPVSEPSACIVFFFGGGWSGGSPRQFYQQADYFRRRGIVAVSAQYRTKKSHKVTPQVCVTDAKSAIRWVRQHADELGIDPERVIAGGGSAGGHVAACTGVLEGLEEPGEDLSISSKPNAMVLFNPVLDTTKKGYGVSRVGKDPTVLSPCHHVKAGIPATLVFHGTLDKTVPYENAVRFTRLMEEAGNSCKIITFEGRDHGFFNSSWFRSTNRDEDYEKTMHDSDLWLTKLGLIKGKPLAPQQSAITVPAAERRIACVGDSNTQRGYPSMLQKKLGGSWKAVNCGIGAATVVEGSLRPYHDMKHYQNALSSNPDYVIIMLGTNDANPRWWDAPNRKTTFDGTVAEEFRSRYLALIDAFQVLESKPQVILAIPLPVFPERTREMHRENARARRDNLVGKVVPIIESIAKEKNLPLVDLQSILAENEKDTIDGVHYSQVGYGKMCEAFKKQLLALETK